MKPNLLQDWVNDLSFMQQTVLLCALRGPDGIRKDHVSKVLLRWYRRCVLTSAFDGRAILNPYYPKGGSFTGPSLSGHPDADLSTGYEWHAGMLGVLKEYLQAVDELPHHFQLHLMHAAEILGYKHPDKYTREYWWRVYNGIVNDAHLFPETEEEMMKRLGDNEAAWRQREHVPARPPK